MSYARGTETTKFARKVKLYLERAGFIVWMDEEDIGGGVVRLSLNYITIACLHEIL